MGIDVYFETTPPDKPPRASLIILQLVSLILYLSQSIPSCIHSFKKKESVSKDPLVAVATKKHFE
jgi:hypothetical protein